MVLSGQHFHRMEVSGLDFVASRKTYVSFTFIARQPLTMTSRSGLWEERTLVRHYGPC